MVLSIGELLADVIGSDTDKTEFKIYGGGAPFNVAVNAKRAGGTAGFIGRVGNDLIGKYLKQFAASMDLDYCDIQTDEIRNTTLAFVTHDNGERDFSFFRHDTADAHINIDGIDFCADGLGIVHLGSLMIGEDAGREIAAKIVERAKKAGKTLSFDVNYRQDVFKDEESAKRIYAPFMESADILKMSEDELRLFGGVKFDDAVNALQRRGQLLLVTLGGNGSFYAYNNLRGFVKTEKVIPIDTTGAGDAFFGTLLKELDGIALCHLNDDILKNALKKANLAGAIATQHRGAI